MRSVSLPRYDLSDKELRDLEIQLVDHIREQHGTSEFSVAWVRPDTNLANFVRTQEAKRFPEVSQLVKADEDRSIFILVVDNRNKGIIVHAASVCGINFIANFNFSNDSLWGHSTTGFIFVDELIRLGNFTVKDFRDFYESRGIDLKTSISIETHFKIVEARNCRR